MLGLGETEEEVIESMNDLVNNGVHILTLGQYLQPTRKHHQVIEYIHPDQFAKYKEIGMQLGFRVVESGPMVRSSYHAEKHLFEF
jgi:lipoic acid synthetase